MSTHPVEIYFSSLKEIHDTGGGTAEESYYGALEALLNEVGRGLKPKVRCVSQLKNVGAGEPDFGLYTANQFQRSTDERPAKGALPERGVIECKPWDDDSVARTSGAQVSNYWQRYGMVLVTNFHDFVQVGRNEEGKMTRLEAYALADSESAFRAMLAQPRKAAQDQGDRVLEFLSRAMRQNAPLTQPEDLAWFLASYAREARARVEAAADLPALERLKRGLEEALGMQFEGEKGEHFFRATLVQTLFYGVFSSWVLWSRDHQGRPGDRFDWRNAAWTLHVPMIASLFDQIATPKRLKPLGVDEVLDWAGMALNRVDRAAFFQKFEEEHAVQYFYEPFLQAYDPELRKELGVWYTPPEIVQYQVERVDRVLREELGLADGLADEQVVVLDPCCGTGAYLVETLKRIHRTLEEKGKSALTAHKLKRAAMGRVFGFEILPAPFVVSHLQIGLMLRLLGAPLDAESEERAGVYLTNALTGWEPPKKPKNEIPGLFPELMAERDAANKVKQVAPILVIIGNPPYNADAGVSLREEEGLVEPYKEGLNKPVNQGGWGIKKFNLDDLYVRFFRIAERRIVKSGKGVVSFISNFSYLGDASFVVMRQRFLGEFDRIWIDCMNGDSRETGKLTPDGKPDPSVFSTEKSPVGIRVGTAVCVMVRREERGGKLRILFQHYWGRGKLKEILRSIRLRNFDRRYEISRPSKADRHSFRPSIVKANYAAWPRVIDLCKQPPYNGLMEKRGGALIDIEREALGKRMRVYFDKSIDWESFQGLGHGLEVRRAAMDPKRLRSEAQRKEKFEAKRLVRYAIRAFDTIWAYYTSIPGVWNRPRPSYWEQCWKGNSFFMTRPAGVARPEGIPFYCTSILGDNDFLRGHAYYFPIQLRDGSNDKNPHDLQGDWVVREHPEALITANLSKAARAYLAALGIRNPDGDAETAALIWMHALAIGYSPKYLAENADGIRQDWPRIPLPKTKKALLRSAELGRRVAALLDTEKPVEGVTQGKDDPRLKTVGLVSRVGGGTLDITAGELDVTAGWGHAGRAGVTMPGKGKTEVCKFEEKALKDAFGDEGLDVYLNETGYWANVPRAVWEYHIGGYQVIKKWLSYREKALLGRGLTMEEAEYVGEMARRIAALILMQGELDANYEAAKGETWAWPEGDGS